jgi:hypothetical protein
MEHIKLGWMHQLQGLYTHFVISPGSQFRGIREQIPIDERIVGGLGTGQSSRYQQ